ncbi:MAG: radical SAM protein [Microcoleus sp.]
MLLLYTTILGYKLPRSEPETVPNQPKSNAEKADSEQENSAKTEPAKQTEQIRKIQQNYHLERRLFQ